MRQPQAKEAEATNKKLAKEAVALAKEADLVIFVGGDNREVETEGSDRKDINLPAGQDELIKAIAQANPNLVTIMVVGAPGRLAHGERLHQGPAYLLFNGSEGGHALADVLTGKISPSGKLPFTFPAKLDDSPAYSLGVYPQEEPAQSGDVFVNLVNRDKFQAEMKADADYAEGIFVGYRWYTTKQVKPLYPFGYGLSYTQFQYSDLQAKAGKDAIEVSFTLSNTGAMDAEEVAQVLHRTPAIGYRTPGHRAERLQAYRLEERREPNRHPVHPHGKITPLGRGTRRDGRWKQDRRWSMQAIRPTTSP